MFLQLFIDKNFFLSQILLHIKVVHVLYYMIEKIIWYYFIFYTWVDIFYHLSKPYEQHVYVYINIIQIVTLHASDLVSLEMRMKKNSCKKFDNIPVFAKEKQMVPKSQSRLNIIYNYQWICYDYIDICY